MAITIRSRPARNHLQYVFIGATVLAAFAAVLPIAAGVLAGVGIHGTTATAFASAPSGQYVVVSRPEDDHDVIAVVPAGGGDAVEIARVPHLPGFTASGAVSPNGRMLALVTVDGGSPAHPEASLLVLDLQSGEQRHLAQAVDPLQTATWARDGLSLVVTRQLDAGRARPDVRFLRVALSGGAAAELFDVSAPLGAYAVGFDTDGALLSVSIDGAGSHLLRAGAKFQELSAEITRDWRLNADATRLAFVEANLEGGLRYLARTVRVGGGEGAVVEAQSALTSGQQLGAAWKPGEDSATFGREPGGAAQSSEIGRAEAQSTRSGFDVPLEYAPDGSTLSVTHWTGASYAQPGAASLQLLSGGNRTEMTGFSRFHGWATR
ncbi:MAG: hypothetical protein ABIP13_11400 [Tepidiformaceae bacterium]